MSKRKLSQLDREFLDYLVRNKGSCTLFYAEGGTYRTCMDCPISRGEGSFCYNPDNLAQAIVMLMEDEIGL